MTTPRNPVEDGHLVNLRTAKLTDAQEIGSGAGGRVYCYRYQGSTNPEDEAWIEPFLFKYKVGDTEFKYLAVKLGESQKAIQRDIDAAYWLFKNYLNEYLEYLKIKKDNPDTTRKPPTVPDYALSYAANWIVKGKPEIVIATKLEVTDIQEVTKVQRDGTKKVVGLNFTTSNAEGFVRKMRASIGSTPAHTPHKRGIQSAVTTDLAITVGQIFGSFDESHYQLLTRKHPSVIHGDLALRNGLVRLIESAATKKLPHDQRIPVNYRVHVTDLGHAILTNDVTQEHTQISHEIPVRWSDAKRLREGKVTLTSDLYAKRISFFESLALLEGNYDQFFYMISPDYDEKNPKYPDLIPIAEFVTSVGNDAALRHYMDNCRNKNLVKNEESLLYLSCFEPYLDVEKSLGKRLDQVTIEDDKALLEACFDKYFEKLLTLKLRSCETDPEAFLVSMHRLVNMRVSEQFKSRPTYQAVKAFVDQLPLDKPYDRTTVLAAVHNLQISMTTKRVQALMDDVKASQIQYEVDILKAQSLLEQENVSASEFNNLENELNYWQDASNQIPSLKEKINALQKELDRLSELLTEPTSTDTTKPRDDARREKLFKSMHQLQSLQTRLRQDEGTWNKLVAKREKTFEQEQSRVYEKILKLKHEYEEAVKQFNEKDGVINTTSPTVELGKILNLFLSIENLLYEYQRLGRYDNNTAETLQSFLQAEVLRDFYQDSAYKALLQSFKQERHKNAEKHQEAERKYRASKRISTMDIQSNGEPTPNPVATTHVETPVTSNHVIPPSQQYGTQASSPTADKANAPAPYMEIPNPEKAREALKRPTTSPTASTPVTKKPKKESQVTYGSMPAEQETNSNQATVSQYGTTQSQSQEDTRFQPTNYKTVPSQDAWNARIPSGRKLRDQKNDPQTEYGSIPAPGHAIPPTQQYGSTQQNQDTRLQPTNYKMVPSQDTWMEREQEARIPSDRKPVPAPGHAIPTTHQYGTTQENTATNQNSEKPIQPYMSMPTTKDIKQTPTPPPLVMTPPTEDQGHPILSSNQHGSAQTQKEGSNRSQIPASEYTSIPAPKPPKTEAQKDVYSVMPNPALVDTSIPVPDVVYPRGPSNASGYTVPVLPVKKEAEQQKDSDAMVIDTTVQAEEPTPVIDADAAARYVSALNALIDYGISSPDDMYHAIALAEYARDSKEAEAENMSDSIANLGNFMLYMQVIAAAREDYCKSLNNQMFDPSELVAIAALKGVRGDVDKITKATQIPVEIIPTCVDLIDKIIKRSRDIVKTKDRATSLPPQPSNLDLQGTLENAYKQELDLVTQLKTLYAYFYNEAGQLKSNQQLGMDLSTRERFALEHLLKPYKELLLTLPVFKMPKNLNTGEGQRTAIHEIVSWRTNNKAVLEKIASCATNQATLIAMTQNLPETSKNAIHTALTAPVQNATTMTTTLDNIHNQEQTNTNLKAILSNVNSKLKKSIETILKVAKTTPAISVPDAFAQNKEAIKTVQRNKIRSLHAACVNHIKQKITDEVMASKMVAVLDLLANYGVKQRTDDKGLLKIKKVQELLTDIQKQNSPEEMLKFIAQKLLHDPELHEHKHFGGDTQIVSFLHQMESALGKKDVAEARPKTLTITKDNPVKTRQKNTRDLQMAILSLLDTTIRLEAGLNNLAKNKEDRDQREYFPASKKQNDFCLFSSKKRKGQEPVELPKITPQIQNHH